MNVIVAFIGLFFFCVFLVTYLQDHKQLRNWEAKKCLMVETKAIVQQIGIVTVSVDSIMYEFQDEEGNPFRGVFHVSNSSGKYPPGKELSIFYNREDPKESISREYLESVRSKGKRALVLALLCFVVAVIGIGRSGILFNL